MPSIGTPVACSDCGKTLRGRVGVHHGFSVSRHKRPDGRPCRGHMRTDHRIIPPKEAK